MKIRGARSARWRWAGIDTSLWALATVVAVFLRFDFSVGQALATETLLFAVGAALLHLAIGAVRGPYAIGHTRGSFEEIADLASTTALVGLLALVANALLPDQLVPRSVPVLAALVALVAMLATRLVLRTALSRRYRGTGDRRTIVLGAGEGGRQLVRSMLHDPEAGFQPVALVDDDPTKRRLRIDGVRVRGTLADLRNVADQTGASAVAVAIPSAGPELLSRVRASAREALLDVLVLPSTSEMLFDDRPSRLRALDLADLLGRRPVELDQAAIASTITGKTVLVTGAGGSIGAELCRQLSPFRPARLLLLDRDESALHATQLSLTGQGLLDSDDVVLADIRDADRMREIFAQHRPQVVFHAAALKHLPLLERYPMEAWKTNVLGTLHVLEAAHASGVEVFVNVSTDKAANPTCVLGYSKRLTERLTSHFATEDRSIFVSVRFGNVLGSRGSVVTAFTAQIEAGGPLTVTHPDVERYFMLIPEACQLVLQAAAIGRDGQVMVLDMGQPSRIVDVARTLIDLSGRDDIEIVYTGLRPGEKMSEELFAPGEAVQRSGHPLVSHVDVAALTPAEVRSQNEQGEPATISYMIEEGLRDNRAATTG